MSFDRLAPFYSVMESLLAGKTLQRCRLAYLDEAKTAGNILLIGEGHGRFLRELARANHLASVCCVDASARMLSVAKDRLQQSGIDPGRVQFVTSRIEDFHPAERFDLIVTQFFLDCFTEAELKTIITKIRGFLKPGGRWILCDFQVPAKGWESFRARIVLFLAYTFFRRATHLSAGRIVPPQPMLLENGLRRLKRCEFNFRLLYAELWTNAAA